MAKFIASSTMTLRLLTAEWKEFSFRTQDTGQQVTALNISVMGGHGTRDGKRRLT
jgi:hypothetical protein